MNVAIVGEGWWQKAADRLGFDKVVLPQAQAAGGNPYAADARTRMSAAAQWRQSLDGRSVGAIVDNGAAGLAFTVDQNNTASARLFHESQGVPLLSHWIDPLVTVFQGMPWAAIWQCLQADTWHKFVWDKPQADELTAFGVPSVHHLPMAAIDRDYKTDPLEADDAVNAVSFVGGQNTSYFYPGNNVPSESLLAGTLAQAVRADMSDVCFYDVFFNLYGLIEAPSPDEPLESRMQKAQAYFNHKLFYNACNCIRQRDRFVIFLKRKLGDVFNIVGTQWDKAYGLPCAPQIPSTEDYFEHFRKTAVNLNLVNGNSDSGLNMRHFEITAAGGFMLCYHQPEIEDMFEVGRECDTFRNEQELLEKIRFYLENADRRNQIAIAGQNRTLGEHLYSHRLRSMLDALGSEAAKAESRSFADSMESAVAS